MKMKNYSKAFLASVLAVSLFSCEKDPDLPMSNEENSSKSLNFKAGSKISEENLQVKWELPEGMVISDLKVSTDNLAAVEPTDCSSTPFQQVISKYNNLLVNDFITYWDGSQIFIDVILDDYFVINQIAATSEDKNTDYFGADGKYTQYVRQESRNLESFWDMPEMITVNGQHTETLEDLDFIRYIYENYSNAPAAYVDYYLAIAEYYNVNAEQIPENPLYASDGFASFNGTIVIGDGIVDMIAEAGHDPKIVWSSILAHEWGHQIQFSNYGEWGYPVEPFAGTAESTRMTELEADFLTGFYLTHKRGGTFNWKRTEGVLSTFFNIGDCGFESTGHHGTPQQRLDAAYAGYQLAESIQMKGMIPSDDEVHAAFLEFYYANYPVTTTAAK